MYNKKFKDITLLLLQFIKKRVFMTFVEIQIRSKVTSHILFSGQTQSSNSRCLTFDIVNGFLVHDFIFIRKIVSIPKVFSFTKRPSLTNNRNGLLVVTDNWKLFTLDLTVNPERRTKEIVNDSQMSGVHLYHLSYYSLSLCTYYGLLGQE